MTPNAVTPSSWRTLRKPGPSPMSSRLPTAQPSPVVVCVMPSPRRRCACPPPLDATTSWSMANETSSARSGTALASATPPPRRRGEHAEQHPRRRRFRSAAGARADGATDDRQQRRWRRAGPRNSTSAARTAPPPIPSSPAAMPATKPIASTPRRPSDPAPAPTRGRREAARSARRDRCWSAVRTTPPTAHPISTPLATSTLPYAPWSAPPRRRSRRSRQRRAGRLALAVAEPEDQQRHDHHPADAEQPENAPAAVPTTASQDRRIARHTRAMPPTRRHARAAAGAAAPRPERVAVLLDVDGVLAPIVSQPDDAHMPETTRRPLIEVARKLRDRRLRLRPPRLRRAPDRLARLDRLPRQPRLGDPAARRDRARARPRAAGVDAARAGLHARGVLRGAASACACGSRTRRRSPRCTGAACRTRRAPRRRSARSPSAPRPPATRRTGAARCSRSGPPVRIDKGAGIVSLLRDDRPRGGDLRRRRPDRPRRLPRARGARRDGPLGTAVRVGVRSDEGPPELEERPTRWSTAPTACATAAAPCWPEPRAVRRLPQGDGPAQRGRGDAARRADRRRASRTRSTASLMEIAVGWWLVAAVIGGWLGAATRRRRRSRGCSPTRGCRCRCPSCGPG